MRLGQLARKLEIKGTEVQAIIKKEFKIEIGDHPNTKVQDEHADFIIKKFEAAKEVAVTPEKPVPAKEVALVETETKAVKQPAAPKETKVKKAVIEKNDTEIRSENVVVPDNLDEVEHIPTQKAEDLVGPVILGKIDVPEPKSNLVEIDGVMVDKNELRAQEKEKQRIEFEAKKKARELAKLKKETELLIQEERHLFKTEQEKKIQDQKDEERRKKKLEYERLQKKERYQKILAETKSDLIKKQKKNKKIKKEIEQEIEIVEQIQQELAELPKGNAIQRFWRWLTTK